MKRFLAVILLLAMILSLSVCGGANSGKIRTARAAISAVKKDNGTKPFIAMQLRFQSLNNVRFTSSSATDNGTGWDVRLEGYATGVLSGMSMGSQYTYSIVLTATISYDGVISNRLISTKYKHNDPPTQDVSADRLIYDWIVFLAFPRSLFHIFFRKESSLAGETTSSTGSSRTHGKEIS